MRFVGVHEKGVKERCKILWRPPTLFACDPFSKDALHVAAGLGMLKSFTFLVSVTSSAFAEYVGRECNSSEQVAWRWLDIKLRYSLL